MKTTEQMNQELQKVFPFLEIIDEYTGANNKCTIRCNDCGYEWQAVPRSVVKSKCGCKKCKVSEDKRAKSLEHFLQKFDTNKYELVEFKDHTNVTVRCKVCGNLRTTNANNICRYGCPTCGFKRGAAKQTSNTQEFVNKAREKHGTIYDYSKVDYVNCHTPVTIICSTHGEFQQTPMKHLDGQGCPKCCGKNKTTEDIINLSKQVHGDKYDYSKVNYISVYDPITIICPKHGEFQQLPYVHFGNKCGCPKCAMSHGEEEVLIYLDKLHVKYIWQKSLSNPYKKGKKFILDFYIPKYRAIIEFNGIQHYEPVDAFGGEEQFKKQVERDEDLRKVCNEYNIKLLEIKYNENIEEKLNIFLENCRALE